MINKPEFLEYFNKYCNLVDAKVNEDKANFYYESLKHASLPALRKAFYFFSCKGFFATIEELMRECGLNPPLSRQQREEIESRNNAKAQINSNQLPSYLTEYDTELVFPFRSFELEKEKAKIDLDNQQDEKLTKNGWTIKHYTTEDEGMLDVVEGKTSFKKHIFIRNVLASRGKKAN